MDDLAFGLRTTVLGMGIVFGVLAILWCLLTLVVKVDERSARAAVAAVSDAAASATATKAAGPVAPGPEGSGAVPGPGSVPDPGSVLGSGSDSSAPAAAIAAVRLAGAPGDLDPRLVAAITVAILRHEETRRLQAAPAMRSYWPGSLLFASRWVAAGRTRQAQTWRRRR
jgi:sodium pump decarboxylase gamma subunit